MSDKPVSCSKCGNENVEIKALPMGWADLWSIWVHCPQCGNNGNRGFDHKEAIKLWNKQEEK